MRQAATVTVISPQDSVISAHMRDVLELLGESPSREKRYRTPDRYEKVIGLSKIPRIVTMVARRLQVQERLTQQIAEAMSEVASLHGVAVLCEASHFCMMMRGVEKQHSSTMTSATLGSFRKDQGVAGRVPLSCWPQTGVRLDRDLLVICRSS